MPLLGHDGPPASLWRENLITGAPLERCPVRTLQLARETDPALSREIDRYADVLYPAYTKGGRMLIKGGVADQPSRYWDIINLFASTETAVEAKALELSHKDEGE